MLNSYLSLLRSLTSGRPNALAMLIAEGTSKSTCRKSESRLAIAPAVGVEANQLHVHREGTMNTR